MSNQDELLLLLSTVLKAQAYCVFVDEQVEVLHQLAKDLKAEQKNRCRCKLTRPFSPLINLPFH